MPFRLRILHQHNTVYSTTVTERVELGRQQKDEQGPYGICRGLDRRKQPIERLIIAPLQEVGVSRHHVLLETLDSGQIKLTNDTDNVSFLCDGSEVAPGQSRLVEPPVTLIVGDREVWIGPYEAEALASLPAATLAPGQIRSAERIESLSLLQSKDVTADRWIQWLQVAMEVIQSAAGSPEFLAKSAQAVVNLVGLDAVAVMGLRENGEWGIEVVATSDGQAVSEQWRPSRTVLARVLKERRTFRRVTSAADIDSVQNLQALVTSPILNAAGEVIAAIYGERRGGGVSRSLEVSADEAMLVELLATGVAAGLARVEQEKNAAKSRVQFEQFFGAELALQLERQPDLLAGKEAEITVLFCDVRGFSRISERLGPQLTVEWISDVLNELSDCVIRNQGVLVDYVGDELIAMWGAPSDQPDQAGLACRAALDMLGCLPIINDRWRGQVREATDVGIGINTGPARVGNTGNQRRFKYGPLGNTVNLASRVQGATKYLHSQLLITESTAAKLDSQFPRRRLTRVQVVNIECPVNLYEVVRQPTPAWKTLCESYEQALEAFESQQFLLATRKLGNLVADYSEDGPTKLLLSRAVNCLLEPPKEFDAVWQLDGK